MFLRLLATSLADGMSIDGRRELDWHGHLSGCSECRALLEAEEALDLLLAGVPRPELPPALVQRVLARLHAESLDQLLELDRGSIEAPSVLADQIVTRARLESLLDRAGEIEVPDGLADRVLVELEAHRSMPRLRLLRGGLLRFAAAAVIVVVLGTVAWRMSTNPFDSSQELAPRRETIAGTGSEVTTDDELLASLDLLDHFELVEELDPLALDVLVYLDAADEIALGLGLDEGLDGDFEALETEAR